MRKKTAAALSLIRKMLQRCYLLALNSSEDEKKKNKSCDYVQSKVQEACFADKSFVILPSRDGTILASTISKDFTTRQKEEVP